MGKTFLVVIILALGLVAVMVIAIKMGRESREEVMTNAPRETSIIPQVTPTPTPNLTQNLTRGKLFLEVEYPTDGMKVSTGSITVKGKTAAGAEVGVDDKDVVADDQGNFSVVIGLDKGENYILIMANDEEGNVMEKEIIVNREE